VIYLLDTNTVSQWLSPVGQETQNKINELITQNHRIALCQPVIYELVRGLLWKQAPRKLSILREKILPQLEKVDLLETDWLQAAQFWAETRRKGRQLSDADLLLAAIAYRLGAVLVSHDTDFDALPVILEAW
jgi:predicted nucleic acid-binding protein